MNALLVGVGGFAGSVLRYWLSSLAHERAARTSFPIGTLLVNVLGCLAVGALTQLVEDRGFLRPEARALLIVGFLGGFTTMSTFANETMTAIKDGAAWLSFLNVALTLGLCLGAVWGGRTLVQLVWR